MVEATGLAEQATEVKIFSVIREKSRSAEKDK